MPQERAGPLARWRHHDHPIGQLVRFGMVGVFTLLVDFATYRLLLFVGVPLNLAKGSGFVVGTTCAYLLNRSWTFRATGGRGAVARFLLLYAATLLVNVSVNAALVHALEGVPGQIEVSFLVAQAISSVLNFLGMRFYVFHPGRAASTDADAG